MKNYTKYAFLMLLVATSGLSAQPSLRDRWNNWKFANSRVGRLFYSNKNKAVNASQELQPETLVETPKPVELVESTQIEQPQPSSSSAVEVPTTWKDSLTGWFNSVKKTCFTKEGLAEAWQSTKEVSSAKFDSAKQWCAEACARVAYSKKATWLTGQYNAAKSAVTNSFKEDTGYGKRAVEAIRNNPYVAAATAGVVVYPAVKSVAKKLWNIQPKHKFAVAVLLGGAIKLAVQAEQIPHVDPRLVASAAGGCAAAGSLDYLLYLKKRRSLEDQKRRSLEDQKRRSLEGQMGSMAELD